MLVFSDLTNYKPDVPLAITVGTFDGVHLGHQQLIAKIKQIAKSRAYQTAILTFEPHPRVVLKKDSEKLYLLSSLEEKIALLEASGVDRLLVMPFTESFSNSSPKEYIEFLTKNLGVKSLVVGYDHRFGKNRAGDFDFLARNQSFFGYEVHEISRHEIDELTVSSTQIRNALQIGDIELANKLLGYAYKIKGTVVHGQKIGRSLGFPTANIVPILGVKLLPKAGIYAVNVLVLGKYFKGMLYIGSRPTIDGLEPSIEVNIFDFDANIYDQSLEIELLIRLRDDHKFENLEALSLQLQQDYQNALVFFDTLN